MLMKFSIFPNNYEIIVILILHHFPLLLSLLTKVRWWIETV